jgi:hypothetical protein
MSTLFQPITYYCGRRRRCTGEYINSRKSAELAGVPVNRMGTFDTFGRFFPVVISQENSMITTTFLSHFLLSTHKVG